MKEATPGWRPCVCSAGHGQHPTVSASYHGRSATGFMMLLGGTAIVGSESRSLAPLRNPNRNGNFFRERSFGTEARFRLPPLALIGPALKRRHRPLTCSPLFPKRRCGCSSAVALVRGKLFHSPGRRRHLAVLVLCLDSPLIAVLPLRGTGPLIGESECAASRRRR